MGDCCWQHRPLPERLRNLCVTTLVLDGLFVLIYSLTALSSMSISYKTECYEAVGYKWHNMVAFCYILSTLAAAIGLGVHGNISCNDKARRDHIQNVSRYANILVCWIFTAAVVEAVAYRNEPMQCADALTAATPADAGRTEDAARAYAADSSAGQDSSHTVWQLAYPLLWIAWVTSTVASAMLAKRLLQEQAIQSRQRAAAAAEGEIEIGTEAGRGHLGGAAGSPEIIGMPIQEPPPQGTMGSSPFASSAPAEGQVAFGSTPGTPGPFGSGPAGMTMVSGSPITPLGGTGLPPFPPQGGSPGPRAAAAGASPAATGESPATGWQGGVAHGGMVAQGKPVAGTVQDPEKGASSSPQPKQAD